MIATLSDRLHSWAKGWVVLLAIAAFLVLVNLPFFDPALVSTSLDGRPGYTPREAFATIASYSDTERTQMIWIHALDVVLLTVYTAMFCLSISWLFQRSFTPHSIMQRLNVVPILGGLFDVLENVWIVTLILLHPARPTAIAWLATISTTAKYAAGLPIVLLLLIGLVKAATNRFRVQEATT